MNWALNIRSILPGCLNRGLGNHPMNTESSINSVNLIEVLSLVELRLIVVML